jgi:hypothetical protein
MAAGLGHLEESVSWLGDLDGSSLRAVLRTAIAERELRAIPRVDLVWTGPEAGFRFDHGEDIFRPLHAAMRERNVEALFFLDIEGRSTTEAEAATCAAAAVARFFERNWPFGEPLPEVFHDLRTVSPESLASLHAKCIVVDERLALVTSANFTERGRSRNIEVGGLIEDPGFAGRLSAQWRGLASAGLLVRVHGSL